MTELSRRRFVLGTGAVAATGALAGCSGNGDGNGNGGNGNGNGNGDGNGGGDDPRSRAETYLNDNGANGFEGLEDLTGESEVTVSVGAGDGFAFEPAGIVVDSGTTVVWEWTGEGGGHNVVPDGDTDFDDFGTSERVDEEGHTVEYTFEEAGVGTYVCEPHRAQGMYGAVVVE